MLIFFLCISLIANLLLVRALIKLRRYMKTTIIPDGTSCGNLEYLKNHLSEIQPIKKITCYQNSENFIFSEYAILTDGVFMAIESWKEKVLLCTGLN